MNSFFEMLRHDFTFAGRQLRRAPGFFAAAALTLALGIGANTAMFSIVYTVLLKPLPFEDPARLVSVWNTAPSVGWKRSVLAPAQYFTYRDETRAFEDVAIWAQRAVSVTGNGEPDRLRALMVTDGFLPILRVQPLLGRRFSREDDAPGAPKRVMITYGCWQQRFGGDPAAIGRSMTIDGEPHEVIGVLPREYKFLETTPAVLVPFGFNRARTRIQDFSYRGLARLKPGVTLEQANADVGRMLRMVEQKFPASPALSPTWFRDANMGPDVHLLSADAAGDVGPVLWVLMGTIVMVLLIACANVANLFLVRAEGRQQELAVRAALGASRGQVSRTLLAESLTLGLAGGVVGVLLAYGAVRIVRVMAPAALPRVNEIGLAPLVLLFAAVLSVVAGLAFGLVPVLKFASPRLAALKEGGRSASAGRERHRTRSLLVVSEIALALVLLVGAGLMVRTFLALRQVDPGFLRPAELLTLDLSIPKTLAAESEQVTRRHEEIVRRIQQVPGVQSVGLTSALPLDGGMSNPLLFEDFPLPEGQIGPSRRMKWISPGYFETMGARVIAGRSMTWADLYGYAPVAMINERLARERWKVPAAAIGRRIRVSATSTWREIIGVVADERDDGLAQEAPGMAYYPCLVSNFWMAKTLGQSTLTYVVRSPRAGSEAFGREIRQAVWSVDRNLPVANVQTMEQVVDESMAQTSFALVMLAIAAVVSVLLGIVGIFGVISYIAAQRTREVGIRMALGAQRGDVMRLFVRHGLVLAAVGIVLGLAAAMVMSRLMASMLFGVRATDPVTYAVVSFGLAAIAALAGYLPSRRAARVDPMVALRSDT